MGEKDEEGKGLLEAEGWRISNHPKTRKVMTDFIADFLPSKIALPNATGNGRATRCIEDLREVAEVLTGILEKLGLDYVPGDDVLTQSIKKDSSIKAIKQIVDPEIVHIWAQAKGKTSDGFELSSFAGVRLTTVGFRDCIIFNVNAAAKYFLDNKEVLGEPDTPHGHRLQRILEKTNRP